MSSSPSGSDYDAWPTPMPVDPEAAAQERRLADEMRRVINRLVLVRPSADDLRRAADAAGSFADSLDQLPTRPELGEVSEAGLRPNDPVRHSPMSGTSNPVGPPLEMWTVGEGLGGHRTTEGRVTFGPAYEGPPGHVHGGLVAAMFDELLGRSQGGPGFTAYLTVTYRRPTPLGRTLDVRAWADRVEGRKRWILGTCHLDGVLLTEAEGLFIAPREGTGLRALQASLARHTSPSSASPDDR